MSKKTATIQDVARHAGVSSATVSRALSNPDLVSEVTRQRVTESVRQTNYTVNQAARSLRMRAAHTILIALPNIGNPFYSTILDAVVQTAADRRHGVLVATPLGQTLGHWVHEYFSSNRADGLLLFDSSIDAEELRELPMRSGRLPLVLAFNEWPDPIADSVTTDNRAASRRVVEHLIELGHTRIGHIAGPPSRIAEPNERQIGYREAMQAAGLQPLPEWTMPGDYSMRAGVAAAQVFLNLKQRPSAMFAANDDTAIGFIAALNEHGVSCPQDVSVVGFDDIEIAVNYTPPLTTMHQPRKGMGRRATEILIDIIEGRHSGGPPGDVVMPSKLIVRKSAIPFR